MKLKDVFDQLTFGELAQVNIGGSNFGEILESNYQKVAASVSLGLTALHTRLNLREGEYVLNTVKGQQTYTLNDCKDITKIERVYDPDGYELALNLIGDVNTVRTTGYRTLVIPSALTGLQLKVVYRANHPLLDESKWSDPENAEIDIPEACLEALLWYVASRMMNPNGFTGGNGFHEGNNYITKYEAACAALEQFNIRGDSSEVNDRLVRNGWV